MDNFPWDMTAVSSNEIYGTKGTLLRGKRVLIGVTGSIAAIEVPHLIREILRYSGEPIVVLSEEAKRFVTLDALTWSTGKVPFPEISGLSEHIRWSVDPDHKVDLFILCPATANSISKLAVGIADGPVTLSALACIGAKIPLIIVPAAHKVLLDNPITEKNIDILTKLGVKFISSEEVENKHKFPSLEKLMEAIFESINPLLLLKGKKVLVTGGATREYIDDIRYISNPSTGLSSYYVANALQELGAEIFLIVGEGNALDKTDLNYPFTVVRSTEDMYNQVKKELSTSSFDSFVSVAAVADYTPNYQVGKIPSGKDDLLLKLQPTVKIVKSIRKAYPSLFIVTYKAEVGLPKGELIQKGELFLEQNEVELVCANWVGEKDKGFMSHTNELFIIQENKDVIPLTGSKQKIGRDLALIIADNINRRQESI
ncbi:MAG: bifunctional phosphopantothenoylcysteine decarboxylase/phosphopantothenate--cysteine ligase CoaBC [Candidatus Hodarchaeales archaeon]